MKKLKVDKSFRAIGNFLTMHTSTFIIAVAILAMFVPEIFSWVKGVWQTVILGVIMLSMGLTLTVEDFRVLLSRPLDILVGTIAQYTVMPLVAFALTRVFHLSPALGIGIILVGCCPGGVSSNIMSYLCKGDVAFSVGMTTVSTLLAPVVTPLWVLWLADTSVDVDAVGMFLNILIVTLIPVGIGFSFNYWMGHKESFRAVQRVMPSVSVLGLACIVGGVIFSVHDLLVQNGLQLFFLTFAVVFCHNTLGYVLGYGVGKIFHFNKAKNRTISIEVGMQNAGLATNLASNFFLATNPLAVVPCAISCAYHSISGTILANIFSWMDKRNNSTRK